MPRDRQFVFAGLPRAIGTCQSCCAVGCAAANSFHVSKTFFAVRYADNNHSMMQESRVKTGNCCFLAAMLRSGGSEYAAYFADQRTLHP